MYLDNCGGESCWISCRSYSVSLRPLCVRHIAGNQTPDLELEARRPKPRTRGRANRVVEGGGRVSQCVQDVSPSKPDVRPFYRNSSHCECQATRPQVTVSLKLYPHPIFILNLVWVSLRELTFSLYLQLRAEKCDDDPITRLNGTKVSSARSTGDHWRQ